MIMASLALILVVLWETEPLLSLLLFAPLAAYDLHQRSMLRALEAMRSATTDPLTGLGNRRRFEQRLDGELRRGRRLSVCLLDLDGLKKLNDTLGHQEGDRALKTVAERLDAGGEAFRIGGDEFALLLVGVEAEEARRARGGIARRPHAGRHEPLRVSGGIASDRDGEHRRTSWSSWPTRRSTARKRKSPGRVGIAEPRRPQVRVVEAGEERAVSIQAATNLARAVEAGGQHSEGVESLSYRIASRLGLPRRGGRARRARRTRARPRQARDPRGDPRQAGPAQLATSSACSRATRSSARTCSSRSASAGSPTGSATTTSAGTARGIRTASAARRSRWPSRIIAVAEAYDTMTSERAYGGSRRTREEAIAELQRCSGHEFDPRIVDGRAWPS